MKLAWQSKILQSISCLTTNQQNVHMIGNHRVRVTLWIAHPLPQRPPGIDPWKGMFTSTFLDTVPTQQKKKGPYDYGNSMFCAKFTVHSAPTPKDKFKFTFKLPTLPSGSRNQGIKGLSSLETNAIQERREKFIYLSWLVSWEAAWGSWFISSSPKSHLSASFNPLWSLSMVPVSL